MATHDYSATGYEGVSEKGYGWIGFATILLGLAGLWNVLEGILAIADSRVYVAQSTFVFSDLNTWGWIMLVLGTAQLGAVYAILSGSEFGRWFGIGSAFVNSIGQMYFLPAYPLWATVMIAIDILIIYALTVYGGKQLRGTA